MMIKATCRAKNKLQKSKKKSLSLARWYNVKVIIINKVSLKALLSACFSAVLGNSTGML